MTCKFCDGKGCLACPGEAVKAERERVKRARNWTPPTEGMIAVMKAISEQTGAPFPIEGFLVPEPLVTFNLNDPEQAEAIKKLFSREVVESMITADGNTDKLNQAIEEYRVNLVKKKS